MNKTDSILKQINILVDEFLIHSKVNDISDSRFYLKMNQLSKVLEQLFKNYRIELRKETDLSKVSITENAYKYASSKRILENGKRKHK